MRRGLLAGALALGLGGCAIAGASLGAGAGGFTLAELANPGTDLTLANDALKLDAPLKAAWCKAHPADQAAHPGLAVYCAHIPTSVPEAIVTWALVVDAWTKEKP